VAAAAVVILGAIAIAWFRYPQTPEDATVQASDSEATSAAAPHPARQRKQREPGTDRNASSDLAPAARNAREGTAGARAEENARRVAEAGQAHAALLEPPATELSQADLRKAIPRGTPTAVALFSGVPILRQPKWAGTPVQVLNTSDLLVVVDSKRRSGWICVMSVASGAEGWVPVNRVRINPGEQ
jgi:hypothetical protein